MMGKCAAPSEDDECLKEVFFSETWQILSIYTGCFIMFSLITNIYNKKTKGPTLMELFTATGKLKKFFLTIRDVRCVTRGVHIEHL